MKLIEGNIETLPSHVHVEQDGSYFFVIKAPRMNWEDTDYQFEPSLAVFDAEVPNCELAFIDGNDHPAWEARRIARNYFAALGITATFDE